MKYRRCSPPRRGAQGIAALLRARIVAAVAALSCATLLLAGCGGGDGSGATAPIAETPPAVAVDQPLADPTVYSTSADASLPTAVEAAAITHHQLALPNGTLRYTATAGHLTSRALATNQPQASFFYVAYTLDGQPSATRPVTFLYNGGPGSASVWLHLGSFGPKRLATGMPATTASTPFPLVDNQETLLDTTDLVFVDAIGTGLSQAIAPNTNATFWGVDADAAAFRDFVRRYLEANNRGASPKYLFGESYGTARSAVLAQMLETAGVALDGVVLLSSALDYGSNCAVHAFLQGSCAGFLPSYAAVGAWYALVAPNPPDVDAYMGEMRSFTQSMYAPAVDAYLKGTAAPTADLLAALVARTGAALTIWKSRFNLDPTQIQVGLLPQRLLGRYDARVSAPMGSPLTFAGDPSSSFIAPSFQIAIGSYLSDALKYTNPSTYAVSGSAINSWDFGHDGKPVPDTIPDLALALSLNPKLRVLSLAGYHDLATPFFQTERDLARLPSLSRVQTRTVGGGHMTYLDDAARVQQKADLKAFYRPGNTP